MKITPLVLLITFCLISISLPAKKSAETHKLESGEPSIVTVEENGFTFQHPGDWQRNYEQKAPNDPIDIIILDCPQNSYLKFLIVDGVKFDTEQKLKDILQSYVTAITTYTKKDIRRWGTFYGQGVQIEGKVMNQFPGGIRIFVSDPIDGKHFIVTEFYYAEDIEAYMRGVDMIQGTLKKSH